MFLWDQSQAHHSTTILKRIQLSWWEFLGRWRTKIKQIITNTKIVNYDIIQLIDCSFLLDFVQYLFNVLDSPDDLAIFFRRNLVKSCHFDFTFLAFEKNNFVLCV